MKKIFALSLAILVCIVLAASFTSRTSAQKTNSRFLRAANPVPGKYIVVLGNSLSAESMMRGSVEAAAYQLAGEFNANVERVYDSALQGFAAEMSEESAIRLSRDSRVSFVEEDAYAYSTAVQSDAPWGLDRIDQRALPLSTSYSYDATGAGVTAYIIDSGIRMTHQDFGGRASFGFDVFNDGQNGNDCYGHGTHVAGTVGSNTYGVAKGVNLKSVRVLDCSGQGMISQIIAGIDWVTANRVLPAVANISIISSGPSYSWDLAVTNSINSGVTYALAAGNFGGDACNYSPARTPEALTVGSTASNDYRPSYSNQGPCVDLFAPGNGILSLANWDDVSTKSMNGTSMAAPHVAGAAALYLQANPGAGPATVSQAIIDAATPDVVWNIDGTTPNRLLYSLASGAPPAIEPASITIIKEVVTASGGTASTAAFGYTASNLGSSQFALIDNDAPPADRYIEDNITNFSEAAGEIVVTEGSISGWSLLSINCTETAGISNTAVSVADRRATIKVEPGESVVCTFTSQEVAPTVAPAIISGRATNWNGRGLSGVTIDLFDPASGRRARTTTNSFGYYSFSNVMTSYYYVVSARSKKRTSFSPSSHSFTLTSDLAGVDFVAIK